MVIEATGKRKSGPVMAAKPKKMKYKHRAAGLKEKDTADGTVVTGTSLIDTQLGQLVAEAKSCQPKRSVVKRCLKEIRYALAAQPAADVGGDTSKPIITVGPDGNRCFLAMTQPCATHTRSI